jgi:hypothetical protein
MASYPKEAIFMSSRNLWRSLTIAALIFAAGISGSWLNAQFDPLLRSLWWGWFGALIAGCAVFGGVVLVTQGARQGWLILLVGALADVTLSYQYFGATHDRNTALVLGLYPTLVAILGGVVEAVHQRRDVEVLWDEADREREWQAQLAREERDAQIKLELEKARIEARTRVRLADVRPNDSVQPNVRANDFPNGGVLVNGRANTLTGTEDVRAVLLDYVTEHPNASLQEIANAVGRSKSSVHGHVQALMGEGRLSKTDNGWRAR